MGFRVHDGDSFYARTDSTEFPVRISGIDAPETTSPWMRVAQPYWKESKQALVNLVNKKKVKIVIVKIDSYGRSLCDVYVDGKNVAVELAKVGAVWHYANTEKTDEIAEEVRKAKNQNVGLWQYADPVKPYTWRKKYTAN